MSQVTTIVRDAAPRRDPPRATAGVATLSAAFLLLAAVPPLAAQTVRLVHGKPVGALVREHEL